MEYILLNRIEDNTNLMVNFNLGELKIMYNACVDILNKHPEMIGYQELAYKLEQVIKNTQE